MNKTMKVPNALTLNSLNTERSGRINKEAVNRQIWDTIQKLKGVDVHEFGNTLPHDYDVCWRSLVVHRGTTKFTRPGNRKSLRNQAFTAYVEYEDHLAELIENESRTDFHLGWIGGPIKAFLHNLFKNFDAKQILRNAPIRFSPGETYISTNGDTSIIAKLSSKAHWTVTSNCVDDAVYLIYHCRGLKLAAKQFFPHFTKCERAHLFSKFAYKGHEVGYYVFRYLMINYVFNIVEGARASSVPKNEETDRFINVEAFFNVLVQACYEHEFRRVCKRIGNDLDLRSVYSSKHARTFRDTQHLHGFLIRFPELCTIDLKNASDSTLLKRVLSLFPDHVCGAILRSRSLQVELSTGDQTTVVYPNKVSSMGNGFTFGLMSLLLSASLVAHGISSNVFGDDIIVHTNDVDMTFRILDFLGYTVNEKKTFVDHPFRESCGYFYYVGRGYIRSFDITYVETVMDLIVVTNKFYLLAQDLKGSHDDLSSIFQEGYERLRSFTPVYQRGVPPLSTYLEHENLASYVYDPGFRKRKADNSRCREVYKLISNMMISEDLSIEDFDVVRCPVFVPERSGIKTQKSLINFSKITKVYSTPIIRGRGYHRLETCLVSPTGVVFRVLAFFTPVDKDINDLNKSTVEKRRYLKLPV